MFWLREVMLFAATAAFHRVATSPQPEPPKNELLPPSLVEKIIVSLVPAAIKAFFWTASLTDLAIVLACNQLLPHAVTACVLRFLTCSSTAPAETIRFTLPFFVSWVVSMAGSAIRLHCFRIMKSYFTFQLSIRKDHRLITSGPYAVVRHPSYAGGALALGGLVLCHLSSGSWIAGCTPVGARMWSLPGLAALGLASVQPLVVMVGRMVTEDAMLHGHFGVEWEEWARRVPYKIIPGVY